MPKKSLKILVVHDDAESAQIVAERFQIYGFVSAVAPSGSDALRMTQESAFDLVLIDKKMKNGSELIKEVQKRAPNSKVLTLDESVTANKIIDIVRQAQKKAV